VLNVLVLDAFSNTRLETIQSLGRHGVVVQASPPSSCLGFSSRHVAQRLVLLPGLLLSQPCEVRELDEVSGEHNDEKIDENFLMPAN